MPEPVERTRHCVPSLPAEISTMESTLHMPVEKLTFAPHSEVGEIHGVREPFVTRWRPSSAQASARVFAILLSEMLPLLSVEFTLVMKRMSTVVAAMELTMRIESRAT